MAFLGKFAAFVVLLGALVFFHELGHFLAAKLFRVKVLRFSLGFGPRIWGFRRGETEYQLAALPLGGYVRMAGENPLAPVAPEDRGRGFLEQPPHRRAIIAFAGPAVNLLLPPLVYFLLNLVPQPDIPAIVGVTLPGEPADRAGIISGDRVVSVDGIETRSFEQMRAAVEARPGRPVQVVVERAGQRLPFTVTPSVEREETPVETVHKGKIGIIAGKLPSYVGVRPGGRADAAGLRTFDRIISLNGRSISTRLELERALTADPAGSLKLGVLRNPIANLKTAPLATAEALEIEVPAGPEPVGIEAADLYLREVDPSSEAWKAGLRPLDRIAKLDGFPVASGPRFERRVRDVLREKRPLRLTVERGAETLELDFLPPLVKRDDPYLGEVEERDYGFAFHPRLYVSEPFRDDELVAVSYPPVEAMRRGLETMSATTRDMLLGFAGLFAGRISTRSIGGPILLFQVASAASERGLAEFLKMFALISINLGIMNLLPVPMLDGFHIVVSGLETVSRRALPLRAREIASYVGLAMVLGLMLLAFYNDLVRTFVH